MYPRADLPPVLDQPLLPIPTWIIGLIGFIAGALLLLLIIRSVTRRRDVFDLGTRRAGWFGPVVRLTLMAAAAVAGTYLRFR